MRWGLIYLLLWGVAVTQVYGQEDAEPVNTGSANYLTIPTDARSAAMGGIGIASTSAEHAIFHNGAAVLSDTTQKGGFAYTYSPWMRDYESGYSLHSLGGFYQINKCHAILLGFRYFGYPEMNGIEEGTSAIHPKEMAVEAGYTYRVIKDFFLSATFKYLYSDMGKIGDSNGASSVAFDLGVLYKQGISDWKDAYWSVGVQASNLGPKINYLTSKEALPSMVKAGGAANLPFSPMHRLIFTADLGYRLSPDDVQALNVSTGMEYVWKEHWMLRGGYHYGNKNKSDACYATAGAGVEYAGIHFDFAWLFAGHECLVRNTFWISLGIHWLD